MGGGHLHLLALYPFSSSSCDFRGLDTHCILQARRESSDQLKGDLHFLGCGSRLIICHVRVESQPLIRQRARSGVPLYPRNRPQYSAFARVCTPHSFALIGGPRTSFDRRPLASIFSTPEVVEPLIRYLAPADSAS